MKKQTDKPQGRQGVTTGLENSGLSKGGTAGFEDNRPEAFQLKKLRESFTDNPRHQGVTQLQEDMREGNAQASQRKSNQTGLPDNLKSGIENLSGYAMDDVKVHFNSSKPAQLQAHAYAEGSDIHLGPGQERHLPHEAWHVVQQKQGRVKPTRQLKGKVNINDDAGLEKEADVMGAKALSSGARQIGIHQVKVQTGPAPTTQMAVVQRTQEDFDNYIADLDEKADAFLLKLDGLLTRSQTEHGGLFRLVTIETLLEDEPFEIVDSFYKFINNVPIRNLGVLDEKIVLGLRERFGYQEFEELRKKLLPDGANVEMKTNGQNLLDVKYYSAHRNTYANMVAKYPDQATADQFLPGIINSGLNAPKEKDVNRGDKFYKLMPPGAAFMPSYSPYYLSYQELQRVMRGRTVADYLGLPVQNYRALYVIWEIEARQDTTIFESRVADTEQKIDDPTRTIVNPGGGRQTLILDAMNTTVWAKNNKMVYLLDPDEAEVNAMGRFAEQEVDN